MKRYQITVEEIVDKPSASPADAPGSIISWQEAQRRVRLGQGVEYTWDGRDDWGELTNPDFPEAATTWTYRIPLRPAEAATSELIRVAKRDAWQEGYDRRDRRAPGGTANNPYHENYQGFDNFPEATKEAEAVTMTAAEATEWLKTPGRAVVSLESGAVYDSGTNLAGDCTYIPLLPATRSQVEMAAANARLKEELDSLSRLNLKQGLELNATREQLASALGSQKAAVAALAESRAAYQDLFKRASDQGDLVSRLMRALEIAQKFFGRADVDDIRNVLSTAAADGNETAGKELGG